MDISGRDHMVLIARISAPVGFSHHNEGEEEEEETSHHGGERRLATSEQEALGAHANKRRWIAQSAALLENGLSQKMATD